MCEHGFATFVLLRSVEICWRSFAACSRNSVRIDFTLFLHGLGNKETNQKPMGSKEKLMTLPPSSCSMSFRKFKIYENLWESTGGWQKHVMPGSWINEKTNALHSEKRLTTHFQDQKSTHFQHRLRLAPNQHQELTPNTKHWLTSNTKNTFRRRGRVGFPFPHWCWGVTYGTPS